MSETPGKPYRLAGICKRCHEFRYGYLPFGRGPFTCYECAEKPAKPSAPTFNLPMTPDSTSTAPMFFTFSISSNDSTSNWKEGQA